MQKRMMGPPPRGRARTRVVLALLALSVLAPALSGPATAVGNGQGSVTVDAPGAGEHARITVSKTGNLVNQTVTVSWTGFRPSSQPRLNNAGGSNDITTTNPVRVYQCRGDSAANPASPSDCYGAPGFRGIPASDNDPGIPEQLPFTYPGQTNPYDALPDGPANWQDAATAADGTGEVSIQLFTKREAPSLGCDKGEACSLVIVPNYGTATDAGATEDLIDAPWAWARRTVVPLRFLPSEVACPLGGTSLDVEGSPTAARLLASWRGKTCTLTKNAVQLDYTAIGEPQARNDVVTGVSPVSLLIDPIGADAAAGQGIVQAPVAATAMVVAFQIDDANGRPVRHMRLTPRLVAKLITASYRTGGNPAVEGNPVNLFRDPDFLALNRGVSWPSGAPGNHILLLGDISDTTSLVTRWIAADKEARDFMSGKPDPYGMKVNSHYRNRPLPFNSYPSLDPKQTDNFEPIQGLDHVSRQLSIAQFPGAITTNEGGTNVVTKQPRQNTGSREVIGIVDAASAADFQLSTADLRNAGKAYVGPTRSAVLAGIAHATKTGGVPSTTDQTAKDKAIYPLSMLVTSALSTKASQQDRTSMANFLSYVAAAGQVSGDEIGRLPGGYVPLPRALVARVVAARKAVLEGYHEPPAASPGSGSGSGSGSSGGGFGGGAAGTTGGTTTPSAAAATATAAAAGGPKAAAKPEAELGLASSTTKSAASKLQDPFVLLPILLALGLMTAVGGPTLLAVQDPAARRRMVGAVRLALRDVQQGVRWRRK